MKTSQIPGFYKLALQDRLRAVAEFADLSEEELKLLAADSPLKLDAAERMIENVVGVYPLPLGIATNFLINGKDYLIPMVIEEPSVVAAASNGAKMARVKGGFKAMSSEPIMIGQVQVVKVPDPYAARLRVLEAKEEILREANEQDPTLVQLGGGAKDLDVKVVESSRGPMVILELLVDCRDAMGANVVNTMAEAVAPLVEEIAGGKVLLRILSNLAVKRLARSRAVVAKEAVGGEEVVEAILEAYAFALADPFRAATHNKGIMNGVTAVVAATGNDTRAVEAGAHAYAARLGRYMPLSTWERNSEGDLVGTLEMPLAVGIVGGVTRTHPIAKIALKILGVGSARELSEVICSVGLAQNLAALRALATEGIQRGHMELHARNVAVAAGAVGEVADRVAQQMVAERKISFDRAKQILRELTEKK